MREVSKAVEQRARESYMDMVMTQEGDKCRRLQRQKYRNLSQI